jgi:hypothetical protein
MPAGTYTLMTYGSTTGGGSILLDTTYPNVTLNVGPTATTILIGVGGSTVTQTAQQPAAQQPDSTTTAAATAPAAPAARFSHDYNVANWTLDQSSEDVSLRGANTPSPTFFNQKESHKSVPEFYASSSISLPGSSALGLNLAKDGDEITLHGKVSLWDRIDASAGTLLGIGLFNKGNNPGASKWTGYLFGNAVANPSTPLYLKAGGNTSLHCSLKDAKPIGAQQSTGRFEAGTYRFKLSIRRLQGNAVKVDCSLEGEENDYRANGTFTDSSPATYAFDRMGMVNNQGLGARLVKFSDVTVTFSTEPFSVDEF